MTEYHGQVRAVIKATRFLSSSRILWFGESAGPTLPRRVTQALAPEAVREQTLLILQHRLYRNFYSKGVASPVVFEPEDSGVRLGPMPFVQELSDANCGVGHLQRGWDIRRVDDATVVAYRNGLEVTMRPGQCRMPIGTPVSPGLKMGIQLPKGFFELSPGFYAAVGNKIPADDEESRTIVRVYWNVTPQSAIDVMRMITGRLNEAGVGFQLKVVSNPARFDRCDAAVLYLDKRDYSGVCDILARTYSEVACDLKPDVPAFTKRLAPGMGLAEDPGLGVSFGEDRCNLLADALISANELGQTLLEDRFQAVVARFQQRDVDLETPYLNRDSSDIYSFEIGRDRRPIRGRLQSAAIPLEAMAGEYLHTATLIASHICRRATWSEGRCNWMGAAVDTARKVNHRALGPELYSGTSGVALFLAELHAATGDVAARSTALGAIRQAISRTAAVLPENRVGLYTGWTGIALASARIGLLTGEEQLLFAARELLREVEPQDPSHLQFNMIAGAAGAVTGLLTLRELLVEPSLLDVAVRLGNALIERADKRRERWSWKPLNPSGEMNLTGFSHGTAGVACALLELFRISGNAQYRVAAERAFEYERYWFDADARNWPDFRGHPSRGVRKGDVLPCSAYWCHGAPGIAWSRLRAYDITGDERWKAEALTALETTRAATESALCTKTMNFSLCHGLAGNAEILLHGANTFAVEFAGGSKLAADVAAAGIERHRDRDHSWPCGAGGPTPNLMVGLAGVGHFYLRLDNPAVPSILLLDPQRFAATVQLPRSHSVAMSS